jgi:hypothetical protein
MFDQPSNASGATTTAATMLTTLITSRNATI